MHKGKRIQPRPFRGPMALDEFVDSYLTAYNGARLREACQLLEQKILKPDVLVGWSLSGAMTPAGFGTSFLVPLIEAGFVDYIVSTGANLYHDIHYGIDLPIHQCNPFADDVELREQDLIRIYDLVMDFEVLAKTDNYLYHVIDQPQFQEKMGTSKFHYLLGLEVAKAREQLGISCVTLLEAAARHGVPIFCSSPGDSTLGLNIAAKAIVGSKLEIDVSLDVNESTALVYDAIQRNHRSAVVIIGGGSPKNFLLQTEPQLQEILGLAAPGHDYFIQITDARPDTGGLSGATPQEAVSWGKVDPRQLPDSIVAYLDASIGLPILGAYVLTRCRPRRQKRLYDDLEPMLERLAEEYQKVRHVIEGEPIRRQASPQANSPSQEDVERRRAALASGRNPCRKPGSGGD